MMGFGILDELVVRRGMRLCFSKVQKVGIFEGRRAVTHEAAIYRKTSPKAAVARTGQQPYFKSLEIILNHPADRLGLLSNR